MVKRSISIFLAVLICLLRVPQSAAPVSAEQTLSEPIEEKTPISDEPTEIATTAPITQTDTSSDPPVALTDSSVPITLNYTKIDVDKGKTFMLTASTNPAGQAVTWSSNSTNATVDSSGRVTGVAIGTATITASLANGSSASCMVYITLANGIYFINNMASDNPLSMISTSGPSENVSIFYPFAADYYYRVYQIWDISYVDNGRYVMRIFYDPSYALAMEDTGNVCIQEVSSSNTLEDLPTNALWTLVRNGESFWLMNDGSGYATLAGDGGKTIAGTNVSAVTFSSGESYRWYFEKAYGIFLREAGTDHSVHFNTVKTIEDGTTSTLAELGMYLTRSGATSNFAWTSSDDGIVEVNNMTGALTAHNRGEATITFTATIDGVVYTQRYKVVSIRSIELEVYYDIAYAYCFSSSAQTRINQQISNIVDFFDDGFYLSITATQPTRYTSHGDLCESAYNDPCRCGTCSNSEFSDEGVNVKIYHHKNIKNMLAQLSPSDSASTFRILYSGHDACFKISEAHYINSNYGNYGVAMWGVAVPARRIMVVACSQLQSMEELIASHEFGHMLGAPDHYGNGCPSTMSMNESNPGYNFSENCMYGENKGDLGEITVCDGCRRYIDNHLQ